MKRKRVWCWLCLALLPWVSFAQPHTIEENLSTLGNLIDESLKSLEHIERDNGNLRTDLENLEASLKAQSLLLREQGALLNGQAESYTQLQKIYETQSSYLASLQSKYRISKWSLLIAAPILFGCGMWLGASL
jgi:hypothetical protein